MGRRDEVGVEDGVGDEIKTAPDVARGVGGEVGAQAKSSRKIGINDSQVTRRRLIFEGWFKNP